MIIIFASYLFGLCSSRLDQQSFDQLDSMLQQESAVKRYKKKKKITFSYTISVMSVLYIHHKVCYHHQLVLSCKNYIQSL